MSSSTTGSVASPVAGSSSTNVRSSQIVIPVTVKQILASDGNTVMVEYVESPTVTILGLAVKVENSPNKIAVVIDDQTGVMPCIAHIGLGGPYEAGVTITPATGQYCRVFGIIRTDANGKYLLIHRLFPVTDLNELNTHMLEVIHLPMKLRKNRQEAQPPVFNNSLGSSVMNVSFMSDQEVPMSGTLESPPQLNQIGAAILDIIKESDTDFPLGVPRQEILRRLEGSITTDELETKLDELLTGKLIYRSFDDIHFKAHN